MTERLLVNKDMPMVSVCTLKHVLGVVCCVMVLVFVSCGTIAQTAAKVKPTKTGRLAPTSVSVQKVMPTATPVSESVYPVRLLIPVIGVNAPIEKVGIQANGAMGTPVQNKWDGVGWFVAGTLPGQQGSTVMDGHLDDDRGAPAVFWNLNKLHVGDNVMVAGSNGTTLRFHVIRTMSYPYNQPPMQEIFGNGGGKYLNLITCAGSWSYNQNQFQQRLVVYTELT